MSRADGAKAQKYEEALTLSGLFEPDKCRILVLNGIRWHQCSGPLNLHENVPAFMNRRTRHYAYCNTEDQFKQAFQQFEMSDRCTEISQSPDPVLNYTRRGDIVRVPPPEVMRPRDGHALAEKGDRAELRTQGPHVPEPVPRDEPMAPRKAPSSS